MSLKDLSEDEIEEYERELLAALPAAGQKVGNTSLIRQLDWEKPVYWAIRARLLGSGIVVTGRGKGGSVGLADAASSGPSQDTSVGSAPREEELYAPMSQVLREDWHIDHGFEASVCEVTAKQGRRDTGGKWSRPDLTIATLRVFEHVPGKHFDVVTFEVKPYFSLDVSAVYEALGHRRSVHKSYVLAWIPEEKEESMGDALNLVEEEAIRHGIGLIVAEDPTDYETWSEWLTAERHEPDPARLNAFLASQTSRALKSTIARWFR